MNFVFQPARYSPIPSHKIPKMVHTYDQLIHGAVEEYVRLSEKIGPEVERQANLVKDLFHIQREFLLSSCGGDRVPSATGTGPLHNEKMSQIRLHTRQVRDSCAHPAHLLFISETIGVMAWIADRSQPGAFIRENYDRGKGNVKAIKQSKSSVQKLHSEWIKSWQEVVLNLETFVNKWHPHGVKWARY